MSAINYITQISRSNPGYVANWPLTRSVTLGSVGLLDDNGFTQLSNVRLQPQNTKSAKLSQDDNATVAKDPQSSSWTVSFADPNGFVLQATGVDNTTAADLMAVRQTVADKLRTGGWDPNWYVVIGLQLAKVATVIVSNGDRSQVTLSGTGGELLPFAGDAKLTVASSTGSVITYITAQYPVLMYRALKVKTAWGPPAASSVRPANGRPAEMAEEVREVLPEMEELTLVDVLRANKFKT